MIQNPFPVLFHSTSVSYIRTRSLGLTHLNSRKYLQGTMGTTPLAGKKANKAAKGAPPYLPESPNHPSRVTGSKASSEGPLPAREAAKPRLESISFHSIRKFCIWTVPRYFPDSRCHRTVPVAITVTVDMDPWSSRFGAVFSYATIPIQTSLTVFFQNYPTKDRYPAKTITKAKTKSTFRACRHSGIFPHSIWGLRLFFSQEYPPAQPSG